MASQKLNIENLSTEAQEVLKLIDTEQNFLLSGGAGSGKTYSLVEILRAVIKKHPLLNIACITYTNAAADEIEERVEHQNLFVSTIHEFLWRNIRHFQKELKDTVIELINDDTKPRFKKPDDNEVDDNFYDDLENGIQYKEFVKIQDGIISHDELIILAHRMYEKYPKLCSITKDTYPFIFVDEYQDTDRSVVEILLRHMEQSSKPNLVGFFGDAMQSIYDGSIGNLDEYKDIALPLIIEVKKEENRRNPGLVIELANHLRSDGLMQRPSEDLNAPNMDESENVKQGTINFLYSNNDDLDVAREYIGWNFTDAKQTKELNLTHNLIAQKAGFEELMRVYDRDQVLNFVRRIKDYIKKKNLDISTEGKTFRDIVEELKGHVKPTPTQKAYIEKYHEAYDLALNTPYEVISKIYVEKDQLIDDKKNNSQDTNKPGSNRDDLIKHLFKIQNNVRLYTEKKYNEFLRVTDYRIVSLGAKIQLKDNIEQLSDVKEQTIGEIIDKANELGVVKVDDRIETFKIKKKYIYDQISQLPFKQFQCLFQYLEGFTPFSTQHKTKGAEFPNVFVILDNGKWNSYNFDYLFTDQGIASVLTRTQKIFYVCCTRAKENLAVFYHLPSQAVINKAKVWFGEENVICLESIKTIT